MKKTAILRYVIAAAAVAAVTVIGIAGCNDNLSGNTDKLNNYLTNIGGGGSVDTANPPPEPALYTLTVINTQPEGGSIEISPAKGGYVDDKTFAGEYEDGEHVAVSAVWNNDEFEFRWVGADLGEQDNTSATVKIIMDGPKTLTANFTRRNATTHNVTIINAVTEESRDGGSFEAGDDVPVAAGASFSPEWRFTNWTGPENVKFEKPDAERTAFKMPGGDVTVTENFVRVYLVTVNSEAKDATASGGRYAAGETVEIYAGTPPEGKTFDGWKEESASGLQLVINTESRTVKFNMPANDVAVTAVFAPSKGPGRYTLAVIADPRECDGSVYFNPTAGEDGKYEKGTLVKITPEEGEGGCVFDYWGNNESDKVSSKNVEVNSDTAITAHFGFKPKIPQNVWARPVDTSSISVSWSPVEGATSYKVINDFETINVNGSSYTFGRLTGDRDYSFSVTAVNKYGDSEPSNPVTAQTYGMVADARDNKRYKTVRMPDGRTWMAENLNYDASGSGTSWCYDDDNANCNKYGRLYDWATAERLACNIRSSGWHLPTRDEWNLLAKSAGAGDSSVAGEKLKSTSGWNDNGNGTDYFGFTALPGGYRFYNAAGIYDEVGYFGIWWTDTEEGKPNAYYYGMSNAHKAVSEHADLKDLGFSVRCIKNN